MSRAISAGGGTKRRLFIPLQTFRETAFVSATWRDTPAGVICTIGPLRFVGCLNAFHKSNPGVAVTVIEGVASRLTELLLEGTLDVALMAQPQPFDKRLRAEPIYAERFGLAFCTGHPLERRNTLHPSDVQGEPYLDRINCEYADHIDELCAERGIKIQVAYRSEREDWIMAMVAAGMGVCFAPEFSATLPGVCHRPVADPDVVRHVSLVSVTGRTLSPAVSAFAKKVRDYDWGEAAGFAPRVRGAASSFRKLFAVSLAHSDRRNTSSR